MTTDPPTIIPLTDDDKAALRATLATVRAEHTKARAAIERVEALHVRSMLGNHCVECLHDYPCPTRRAIEGTTP